LPPSNNGSPLAFSYRAFYSIFLPGAAAQTGSGILTGRITDRVGGVLQGARVDLQPSGAAAVTNNHGEYKIVNIDPGVQKLSLSFIGFAPYSGDVTIAAGTTTRVDQTLAVRTNTEKIIVTADRPHGEAEAINRERTAENIMQVLPAEVITSLPNANVADAVGRLPSVTLERDEGEGKYVQIRGAEPRYSNVTIDGVNVASPENVRQIKLDILPSDLVESVEINKTLLASGDGDALGGSVNLRTKTAGEQPTASVFGLAGYNPIIGGRHNTQYGATLGKRFGKEKKLGVLFGGTYDYNGRGIDDIEPGPQTIQCDPGNCGDPSSKAPDFATYAGTDFREYRYERVRWGMGGSVDYKISDPSNIYIRGLYIRTSITLVTDGFTAPPSTAMVLPRLWAAPMATSPSMRRFGDRCRPSAASRWEGSVISESQSSPGRPPAAAPAPKTKGIPPRTSGPSMITRR